MGEQSDMCAITYRPGNMHIQIVYHSLSAQSPIAFHLFYAHLGTFTPQMRILFIISLIIHSQQPLSVNSKVAELQHSSCRELGGTSAFSKILNKAIK